MERILGNLDFMEILTVRKVCHSLRDFIDNGRHPSPNLSNIRVFEIPGSIESDFQFSHDRKNFSITYEPTEGGKTSVKWRWGYTKYNVRIVDDPNYREVFSQDFGTFWENQAEKLEEFYVSFDEKPHSEFLEEIRRRALNRKFEIQKLKISTHSFNEILQVLPLINPEDIVVHNKAPNRRAMRIKGIMELDAWKNARSFQLYGPPISIPVEKLLHFQECEVKVKYLSFKDVERVRRRFIVDSNIREFDIAYKKDLNAVTGLIREFGNPYFRIAILFVRGPATWFFRTEDPTQVAVIMKNYDSMVFKKIPTSDVPSEARSFIKG